MKISRQFFNAISGFAVLSILLFCSGLIADAFAMDVMVICNKSVPESSLTKSELRNIFLGKKQEWSTGDSIIPVTLKKGEAHKAFCKIYLIKSPSQFIAYWKKMLFTGKGMIPKSFDNEKEMVDFIATTKGAIGYVSAGQTHDHVKVLQIY